MARGPGSGSESLGAALGSVADIAFVVLVHARHRVGVLCHVARGHRIASAAICALSVSVPYTDTLDHCADCGVIASQWRRREVMGRVGAGALGASAVVCRCVRSHRWPVQR